MLHGSVRVPAAAEGHARGTGAALQVTRDRQVAGQGSQVAQEAGKIEIYYWVGDRWGEISGRGRTTTGQ